MEPTDDHGVGSASNGDPLAPLDDRRRAHYMRRARLELHCGLREARDLIETWAVMNFADDTKSLATVLTKCGWNWSPAMFEPMRAILQGVLNDTQQERGERGDNV